MRIISGHYRGRRLATPKGELTRPTADRTRETLFNMLTSRIGTFEGLKAADLFAGSGALGIEALSRGVDSCLFIEQDLAAISVIRANIASLELRERARIQSGSVLKLGKADEPLDLILIDPPYRTSAGTVALERMLRLGWIGEASWIALETAKDEETAVRGLALEAERRVGKAKISILRMA